MFNLPDRYRTDVKVDLKDFIPNDIKPNDKKRIRNAVKNISLSYQIVGEEIPSVVDDNYRCQVIQFYEIELENIKEANFLASIYQSLIKPFCVIRMYDTKDEVYSLAVKRLNQIEETQIVIEHSLLTEKFALNVPDSSKNKFLEYIDFVQVKNKQNKVNMYKEWFYKTYIIQNEKAYSNAEAVLEGNFWYDSGKAFQVMMKYMELVKQRDNLKKAVTNAERMESNKMIKKAIEELNKEEW